MANETPIPSTERLRQHVDPRWSRSKVERELDAIERRVAARASWRLYLAGAVVFAGATLVMLIASRGVAPVGPSAVVPQAARVAAPASVSAPAPLSAPTDAATPEHEQALAVLEEAEVDELDAGSALEAPRERGRRQRRAHAKRVRAAQSRVVVAALAWQSLAREGRYHEAYVALSRDGLDRQHSAVEDLLLAGDAARLSGHAREAVPYYRDALARAGQGPRAHLSAFTLGRTLLHDLKDARGAAHAFARAYAAAPRGQLAEEALAGEADSWTRAGDRERARAAARRYLAAFPHGRRAADMERVAKAP